jgi:hypothetical protein
MEGGKLLFFLIMVTNGSNLPKLVYLNRLNIRGLKMPGHLSRFQTSPVLFGNIAGGTSKVVSLQNERISTRSY